MGFETKKRISQYFEQSTTPNVAPGFGIFNTSAVQTFTNRRDYTVDPFVFFQVTVRGSHAVAADYALSATLITNGNGNAANRAIGVSRNFQIPETAFGITAQAAQPLSKWTGGVALVSGASATFQIETNIVSGIPANLFITNLNLILYIFD
jgi:hypothetical protein